MADEHPRVQSARDHDDKDIIEGMIPAGGAVPSTGGGALARDLGSQDDLHQVDDPDGHERVTKQAAQDAGQSYRSDRPVRD
ncbi:hypothetical protein ASE95_00905 [Sphingomonas sp. Leaf231]|uniref:hypothetical protein n=1 Tax=Sphingomonas sp. Leaf231 TaxID=1736301 RepID=UPI0006F32DA3|nr:hypothetical protein [Sphingomonas sp. Leaf231]KQN93543.1 hypothetical protein ASE95_00905 [Sphingomonas sp. Leaf231]